MKLIAILIWSVFFFNPVNVSVEKWVIEKNSSLSLEGKSNVNSFKCDIVEYLNRDTILLFKDNSGEQKPILSRGGLTININRFDCHQNYVTADLKKTLKAKDDPYMKVNLVSFGYMKPHHSNQAIKGIVEIQLAGVTRKIEIDYAVNKNHGGVLNLIGTKKLLFSDFRLTPPKKLAGLIKVEEEITVSFQLILRYISVKPA